MCAELAIFSIEASSIAPRLRAFRKYNLSNTFIAELIAEPFKSRSLTWVSKCSRFITRTEIKSKDSPRQVKEECDLSILKAHDDAGYVSAQWYVASNFTLSRSYLNVFPRWLIRSGAGSASMEAGLRGLVLARSGGFCLAPQLARMGSIDESFLSCCPCCGASVRETLYHLFFVCSLWASQRYRLLSSVLYHVPSSLPHVQQVIVLLGGVAPNSGFSLGKRWVKLWKNPSAAPPLFIYVVRFLAAIRSQRASILSRWSVTLSQGPSG